MRVVDENALRGLEFFFRFFMVHDFVHHFNYMVLIDQRFAFCIGSTSTTSDILPFLFLLCSTSFTPESQLSLLFQLSHNVEVVVIQ